MFLFSYFDFWLISKDDPLLKNLRYLKSSINIGVAGYSVLIIFSKTIERKIKKMMDAELRNINSVLRYELLKLGKKTQKKMTILDIRMGTKIGG